MTNTTTAMTREQAEQVTTDIREAGKSLATARTKFASAVKRAKDGDAHTALGFKSWPEYVATVFADMPGLAKGDREYLTGFMAGEGMSSRAVARVLGVSQATASRMIRALEDKGEVESDREVTGTDGKGQSAKGKGRGRAKGEGKGKGKGKGEGESVRLTDLDSEQVGQVALDALKILNDRWREGDEQAEGKILDVLALLDSHKITA